jgi:hypothetical protein
MRVDWDDTVAGDYEQELQISVGPNGCAGPFTHFGYIGPGLTALPVFNLQEAQFYCFQVRGIRDATTTTWNKSNVAITWTSNLPYITGKVTLADGVTPVAKMPVKWLATGAYAGSDNQNALVGYTNLAGEYVLQVPNGTEGELFLNTSRWANRGLDTIPPTPWGMEAGGKLTITQDTVVDIKVPSIKTTTVTVVQHGTNQPVVGGKVQFVGDTKGCVTGSYTPFASAITPRCLSWPAGYAHSGPVTDAQGKVVSPRPGEAEVLLIGDSFCRIFEEGSAVGAGLRSQLAVRLCRPVAMVQQDGGGATLVRQELVRRPEWLQGVKVVVWEFAERDLTSVDAEWAEVELPR